MIFQSLHSQITRQSKYISKRDVHNLITVKSADMDPWDGANASPPASIKC